MSPMSPARTKALHNGAILYGCVIAGGILGSVARYLVSVALLAGGEFPWATLIVNVTGSFLIGLYAGLTGPSGRLPAGEGQRLFVMTGFCGGYTTFSAFSLETFMLWQSGLVQLAAANIGASIAGSLLAVWIGHALAARINPAKGG